MPHADPEARKRYSQEYRKRNRARKNELARQWRKENTEKNRAYFRNRYKNPESREKILAAGKKWRDANPEKQRAAILAWKNRQYKTNPAYKTVQVIRTRLREFLKNKTGRTKEYFGCSPEAFVAHIESLWIEGMSWANFGNGDGQWNLDHTVPISRLIQFGERGLKVAFNWRNTRPMWAADNTRKLDSLPPSAEIHPMILAAIKILRNNS